MSATTRWLTAGAMALLLGMGAGMGSPGENDRPEIALTALTPAGVTFTLQPRSGRADWGRIELCDLDGDILAQQSRRHGGHRFEVSLAADLDPSDPAAYYVRYRLGRAQPFRQKSLFFLGQVLETIVLAQRDYLAGSAPRLRVLVRDRAACRPVNDARVRLVVKVDDQSIFAQDGLTNQRGEAELAIELPDKAIGQAVLEITAETPTAHDVITETIRVINGNRTLLTTDKPRYQPGQTIHLRALTLTRPGMAPLQDAEALFEIEDAKGNKVFKTVARTDRFGVSSADFVLADELNQGAYRIRHLVGGVAAEKSVTVERYVLPKFAIELASDRKFYQPGETVRGSIQADYFFGKPVADSQVHIACAKFDVGATDFQAIAGRTDANGHYAFEIELPDYFVGQPLAAGQASVRLEITVIDNADHREQITRHLAIAAEPILIAAVPESGELVPDLPNLIHIVTTYADASPAPCRLTWLNAPGDQPLNLQTDAGGFAELSCTPAGDRSFWLRLRARDDAGLRAESGIELPIRQQTADDRILLRADHALYRVGDAMQLTVMATRADGPVYLDMIKDRQTQWTATWDLREGRAAGRIALGPELAGTIQVNAYLIGENGVTTRDRRIVIVDPANELDVTVQPGAELYRPGQTARINLRVRNQDGRGVTAAVGVMVVDEAVFALQEMQPGLEKIYFYLEKEIATPRIEIHGLALDDVLLTSSRRERTDRRDRAGKVILAAARGGGDYPIQVNTYRRDQKGQVFQLKMTDVLTSRFETILRSLRRYCEERSSLLKAGFQATITLEDLVIAGHLRRNEIRDPWGEPMRIEGASLRRGAAHPDITLLSAGIDRQWRTADDVALSLRDYWSDGRRSGKRGEGVVLGRGGRNGIADLLRMPRAAAPEVELPPFLDEKKASALSPCEADATGSAAAQVRVRHYFPETLYFQPSLITDASGEAVLDVPLADSITEWRLTCMASSATGQLGSATSGIKVFQDFFVDVDFPVSLTQHDEVSVPVAIYNYLETEQTVRLEVEAADWFELTGERETAVTLKPSEVGVAHFPIVANGIGHQKFTVYGHGGRRSDAVSRTVEIVPDGRETLVSFSGRLTGQIAHRIPIPGDAIDGASKIFVKVYPGVLSQVVEGLDKMLRMPFGCFEQTSSVTYPNILVLDYLITTEQDTPELRMKAEGFINSGYQRLLSFEVDGGGFEWFGRAPAHPILTAYGLMEFHDMNAVLAIDPAVITRTQAWLAARQREDGSFPASEGGIAEGAINKFQNDVLRSTAYVTWALAHTGYQGPELGRGIRYLENHLNAGNDNFTLAVAANALATVHAGSAATDRVLRWLYERRTERDEMVHWECRTETSTHGLAEAADIETTALAVQAFVKTGRRMTTVARAVSYLIDSKDAHGTWHSTQASVQALRAMLMAESAENSFSEANVAVSCNGRTVRQLRIDRTNSDVLQLIDLMEFTQQGENEVRLSVEGEGALLYQVVGRYWLPHDSAPDRPVDQPLDIELRYDRTRLATDDLLRVTAEVACHGPGRAKMVVVDLGLPPGFTLIRDDLNRLVERRTIQKYSVTGRQVIVYLDELTGEPLEISYQLRAKHPLKAKTLKSAVYEYYNPQSRAEAAPTRIEVTTG